MAPSMPYPVLLAKRGPNPPMVAGLGGTPTKSLDVPITSVFLVLFALCAATHMTIFRLNLARGRKFVFSAMTFGFCMARITACTMRLVWSTHLTNVSLAIAAQVFVAAGVLLLFVINLVFVQRLIRSSHPHLGWARWFSLMFKVYYFSIVFVIITLITAVVQSFYARNPTILQRDRKIMLFGGTYFAVSAFLPIIFLAIRAVLPRRGPLDRFGDGSDRAKVLIVLISSIILTLGAAFRAGTSFLPRPISNPAWYHSKACFYLFNFTIELFVVVFWAAVRVDRRFIVPNGCHAPGDYERKHMEDSIERKDEDESHDTDETNDGGETNDAATLSPQQGHVNDSDAEKGKA